MAARIPRINIGFENDGLIINRKRFHPLNIRLYGVYLESEKRARPVDPDEIMDALNSVSDFRVHSTNSADRVEVLKTLINSLNRY